MKVNVQPGDTLSGLTRQALGQLGQMRPADAQRMPFRDLMARIHTVAEHNQIQNPDRILAGQTIDFSALINGGSMAKGPVPGGLAQAAGQPRLADTLAANEAAAVVLGERTGTQYRVLERTLDRAVAKGYIPTGEVAEVKRRILDMSREHRFNPDDFARVALMESDGLNPRATNGNCHGVIQFCDGPDRGAASAGYGKQPEKILDLSVLEQLDLVERYFEDTGLQQYKPASLDNLYLTVLYPAGRNERQMHRDLGVPGPQAAALHVGGNQNAPITRASLRKGLVENANARLTQFALAQAQREPLAKAETNGWRRPATKELLAVR
ncbi:LysM domain [Burkholderiales bacterium]